MKASFQSLPNGQSRRDSAPGSVSPMPRGLISTIRAGDFSSSSIAPGLARSRPQSTPAFTTTGDGLIRSGGRDVERRDDDPRLDVEDQLADRASAGGEGAHDPGLRRGDLAVAEAEQLADLRAESASDRFAPGASRAARSSLARSALRSNTDLSLKSRRTWPDCVHCRSASDAIEESGSSRASSCLSSQRDIQRAVAIRRGRGEAVRLVRLEQVDPLAETPAGRRSSLTSRNVSQLPWMSKKSRVPTVIRVGFGRPHGDVVGMLHPGGDLAGDVLLGVLRADRGEQPLERRDVARRRRHGDPVVERHQVGRQGAAARVAGAAQPSGIDLGPARPGSRVPASRPRSGSWPPAGRPGAPRSRPWCARSCRGSPACPASSSRWNRSPWPIGS